MLIVRVKAFSLRWKAKEVICVSRKSFRFLLCAFWSRDFYHSVEFYVSRHIWVVGLTSSARKPVRSEAGWSVLGLVLNYVPSGTHRPAQFLRQE